MIHNRLTIQLKHKTRLAIIEVIATQRHLSVASFPEVIKGSNFPENFAIFSNYKKNLSRGSPLDKVDDEIHHPSLSPLKLSYVQKQPFIGDLLESFYRFRTKFCVETPRDRIFLTYAGFRLKVRNFLNNGQQFGCFPESYTCSRLVLHVLLNKVILAGFYY